MTDDQLTVQRAIQGDERALRSLWTRYSPYVDAVVRRLVNDPDAAADVAQEVWIQIFKALPTWRGESAFSTW
ncbi:MAG: helix-turn-helix domain-containing protein, partial [Gemmatimonadetes bacterium]|nr:helix-turn-helix domain-containing protein [Gemmatimonadota bacterium]